jgi:hypothetical protein
MRVIPKVACLNADKSAVVVVVRQHTIIGRPPSNNHTQALPEVHNAAIAWVLD